MAKPRLALLISASAQAFAAGYVPTAEDVAMARRHQRGQGVRGSDDAMLQRTSDLAAMVPYWDQTDAIVDGIKAMRLGGSDFLPKFSDEEDDEFEFRLSLTKMTNVYRDIIESLSAKPFEREVMLIGDEIPAQLSEFCLDVDGAGNNITAFTNSVFFNGINSAIDWIYIDFPKVEGQFANMAAYKAAGMRPYWSRVLARNVIRANSKMINGVETLTYIRIFEPGDENHIREFTREDSGKVTWKLYKDTGKKDSKTGTAYVEIDNGTLKLDIIPVVPFITGRRDGRTWKILPAMQDAADLQVELYQQESGLKFAKTLTAYPMLSANGVKPATDAEGKPKKLKVGPNRILYAPPDGAGKAGNWEYVEPSAESLKFLASDIIETIKELRELGRQPLTVASQNLTKETTQVAAGKAKSAIKQWAVGLENALLKAFAITVNYYMLDYVAQVDVYKEFDEFYEDGSLDALATARGARDLSQETLWAEFKRRGVLSKDFDPQAERDRLLNETPTDNNEQIV